MKAGEIRAKWRRTSVEQILPCVCVCSSQCGAICVVSIRSPFLCPFLHPFYPQTFLSHTPPPLAAAAQPSRSPLSYSMSGHSCRDFQQFRGAGVMSILTHLTSQRSQEVPQMGYLDHRPKRTSWNY